MPTYLHRCDCGATLERVAPMAEAGNRPKCPSCRQPMDRDYAAEQPRTHAYQAYLACSGGAAAWEMESAYQRGRDWFRKDDRTGKEIQLNPPGFDLDRRTGDVKISNRAERRRYLQTTGLVEIR